jgi:hypothetical protein
LWVVAKTVKGLKWKIQKANKGRGLLVMPESTFFTALDIIEFTGHYKRSPTPVIIQII